MAHQKDLRSLDRQRLRLRRVQLVLGLRLARIQRKGSFLFSGAASFGEFAEKRGLCAGEARILAGAASVAAKVPAMRRDLLEGRTCTEKLACVARALEDPDPAQADPDWGRLVREETASDLRSLVRKRPMGRAHGTVFPLKEWLSPRGAEAWVDCKEIATRKARRPLLGGEVLEEIFVDYRDRYSDLAKAERAAARGAVAKDKAPVVKGRPGQPRKAMPAAERHALVLRNGDRCAIEGCDSRAFLENAHRIPHRAGGPAIAANEDRLCHRHHRHKDSGEFRDTVREGRRVLVDRAGDVVAYFRTSRPPP